jgi:hypothetical protein
MGFNADASRHETRPKTPRPLQASLLPRLREHQDKLPRVFRDAEQFDLGLGLL